MEKYIGKSFDTYNCFDLVKEYYWDVKGLDIKHFWESSVVPPMKEVETLICSNLGHFKKTASPREGDLVVLRLFGIMCHVGIYAAPHNILHSVRHVGSCIEPLSKYKHVLEGFYFHNKEKK